MNFFMTLFLYLNSQFWSELRINIWKRVSCFGSHTSSHKCRINKSLFMRLQNKYYNSLKSSNANITCWQTGKLSFRLYWKLMGRQEGQHAGTKVSNTLEVSGVEAKFCVDWKMDWRKADVPEDLFTNPYDQSVVTLTTWHWQRQTELEDAFVLFAKQNLGRLRQETTLHYIIFSILFCLISIVGIITYLINLLFLWAVVEVILSNFMNELV